MRCPFSRLAVLSLPLMLAACGQEVDDPSSAPLGAAPMAAAKGPAGLPFRGTCRTEWRFVDFVYLPPPNDQVPVSGPIHHAGTCQLTHLGRATLVLEQQIDLSLIPSPITGVLVLTSANGDQLYGSEVTSVSGPDEVGGDAFHGSGEWTWTGGTGRFAGATGLAGFSYTGSFGAQTLKRDFNGRISY